ncbi:phage tail protein [Abyssibius alkaniclasticus]|uniref:phage tail protein n=1 Tax=Abyssibius alkaniclasticus TaxID=2881234 RepID=UPI004058459D
MPEIETDLEQLDALLGDLQTSIGGTQSATLAFQREMAGMNASLEAAVQTTAGLSRSISNQLGTAFDALIFDGAKLSDVLLNVARGVSNTAYSQAMKPLTDGLGSLLSSGITNLISGIMPFAQGGVMTSGRVSAFAFATRDGRALLTLEAEGMALGEDTPSPVQFQRGEDAPARVRISFFEGDNAYQSGAAEAARPDAQSPEVSHSGLGLVLGMGQAQAIAERWLNEARVARDAVQFALPPSQLALDAGDVVRLRHSGETAAYRIDRIEDMGERRMSAVRVEPGVYKAAPMTLRRHERGGISTAGPVYGMLLDLPLLAESDVPHAPYMGVAAAPWPGAVSVLSAAASSGFELVGTLTRSMVLGKTQQDLPAAMPGRWQRGAGLEVKLDLGQLQSRAPLDVLGGANAAALRLGGAWEIIQFETAELIAPLTYRLDGLLRGQRGTDALMPEIVPAGADFVLLDGAQAQPDFSLGQIGAARQYRIGPANRPYDDMRYHAFEATHEGAGLRPYAPVHLRAGKQGSDLVLSWIRRGRLDNDSWLAGDIPLGEEAEAYRLRIFVGGELRRDVALSSPAFTYSAAAMAADGATPSFEFEIAQLSASIGAGLVARKTVYV